MYAFSEGHEKYVLSAKVLRKTVPLLKVMRRHVSDV